MGLFDQSTQNTPQLPSNWQSTYTGPSAAMVGWQPSIQDYASNNNAGFVLPSNSSTSFTGTSSPQYGGGSNPYNNPNPAYQNYLSQMRNQNGNQMTAAVPMTYDDFMANQNNQQTSSQDSINSITGSNLPTSNSTFGGGMFGMNSPTNNFAYGGGFGMPMQNNNINVPNNPLPTTGQTTPTPSPYGANPFMGSTSPYIQAAQQTNLGNINAAQVATAANRVNQNTPYGSLQYSQTGVDANGNPIWSANQTLSKPLENLTNTALGNLQSSLETPMYGINPGQTYSDAIMSRLQPQIAHQNEMSDQALANQGIMPGSQAYENAKRVLGQQQNDLLTSAIINGMNTGLAAQGLQNTTATNVKALGTPNYVNPYTQAAVAAPDYLGAYSTQNAADIAKANADMARQSNLTNGLLGLGSSALLGGTGTGSALGSIGGGLSDLYKYFKDYGVNQQIADEAQIANYF